MNKKIILDAMEFMNIQGVPKKKRTVYVSKKLRKKSWLNKNGKHFSRICKIIYV